MRHASFSSKLFLLYSLACFNMSKNVLKGKGIESKKKYFFRLQAIPSEQIGRDSETAGEDALTHVLTHSAICFYFVENNGFEPLTPCLQSRCSSQLS